MCNAIPKTDLANSFSDHCGFNPYLGFYRPKCRGFEITKSIFKSCYRCCKHFGDYWSDGTGCLAGPYCLHPCHRCMHLVSGILHNTDKLRLKLSFILWLFTHGITIR